MELSDAVRASLMTDRNVIPPPPPATEVNSTTRNIRMLVDSRHRDRALYPLASNFVMPIEDPVESVVAVKLLHYSLPINSNMVNPSANKFYFTEQKPRWTADATLVPFGEMDVKTVEIEPGNYSPTDLAAVLQSKINTLSLATISVSYNENTGRFSFVSDLYNRNNNSYDTGFNILFRGRRDTMELMLGFDVGIDVLGIVPTPVRINFNTSTITVSDPVNIRPADTVIVYDGYVQLSRGVLGVDPNPDGTWLVTTMHAFTSPSMFNTTLISGRLVSKHKARTLDDFLQDYVLLNIRELPASILPANHAVGNAFAILHNRFDMVTRIAPYTRTFNPPLRALSSLNIQLHDWAGKPLYFDEGDVILELMITVQLARARW